jgi:hypothetical protein
MKCVNKTTFYNLEIYGNLGFNGSSAYNAQPGVYTTGSTYHFNPAQFPLMTQWVFANPGGVLIFLDGNYSIRNLSGRWIVNSYLGSIESYKSGETEGNILIAVKSFYEATQYTDHPYFCLWSGFTCCGTTDGEMYYLGAQRTNGAVSSTVTLNRSGSYFGNPVQSRGFSYNTAVKMSSYTNKAPIIKPIISLSYAISGYNYFHPIGELPYYATAGYPYFLPGDTTYYGQRKFTIIEMGDYQSPYGVAIETGN